jgi:hypothetical protein
MLRCFAAWQASTNLRDLDGHGTLLAGVVGGVGNNGIGVTGVAWKVWSSAVNAVAWPLVNNPQSEMA